MNLSFNLYGGDQRTGGGLVERREAPPTTNVQEFPDAIIAAFNIARQLLNFTAVLERQSVDGPVVAVSILAWNEHRKTPLKIDVRV